jgi:sugar phosphate isomerase/epimerase
MNDDVYELGMSEFTTWPWSFERDVERYRSHGIDAIEITEIKLDRECLADQLGLLAANGLKTASVQATIHSLFPTRLQPEPREPADRVRHVRASIERIAPYVAPQTPFVVITGAAPHGDAGGVLRTARRELRELARCADANGVRLALEPLNPALMNVDSAVWALGDALDVVEDVGHPAFGLCVDTWNVWQSPRLDETIRRAGERIFLVQVGDWRPPRGWYDRLVPGDGRIPLAPIVAALRAAGYARPYVVELFSSESLEDSLWRADLDAVLDRSIVGFERVWNAVVEGRAAAGV